MAYESLQYKKHIKIDTIRDSYARTVTSSTKSDDRHYRYREYRRETSNAPSVALEDSMLTISFSKNRRISQLDNRIAGTNPQTH